MDKNEFLEKCIDFSVKINGIRKYLREMRSGTSIGANYSEACNAVSKADFMNKLAIAQKEAHETIYWLKVLFRSELITKEQYDDLMKDVQSLHKILSSSIATLKEKDNKS